MILAVLQARMSSSRLPGKVLRPIMGRSMLGRQIDRVRQARRIDRLVVATSTDASDDVVAAFCAAEDVDCHRGSLLDLISRFRGAIRAFGPADHIVRLTGDCPLADWTVIDACVELHLSEGAEYTGNSIQRTYPDGLDVEILTMAAFDRLDQETADDEAREHVTTVIYRHPERYRLAHLVQPQDRSAMRWTVDTLADFRMVETVFHALLPVNQNFRQEDVVRFLSERPDVVAINVGACAVPPGHDRPDASRVPWR